MRHVLLILLASAGAAQADVKAESASQNLPLNPKTMTLPAKPWADSLVLCYLPGCMPMQMRRVDDWPASAAAAAAAAEFSSPEPRQRDTRQASDVARLFWPVPAHETLQRSASN